MASLKLLLTRCEMSNVRTGTVAKMRCRNAVDSRTLLTAGVASRGVQMDGERDSGDMEMFLMLRIGGVAAAAVTLLSSILGICRRSSAVRCSCVLQLSFFKLVLAALG